MKIGCFRFSRCKVTYFFRNRNIPLGFFTESKKKSVVKRIAPGVFSAFPFEDAQSGIVVGFVGYFIDQFGILHLTVFANDDDGAC